MAGETGHDERLQRDEYGDLFEDYGFLKRAEASKAAGNEAFKKDRYEKALEEYDKAVESLLTVAHDKSILIGKRKWNDVIVLRSTLNLNKSTCHYKLKNWQASLDAALECLVGSHRDEMLFTDPHIRQKVKESDRKHGHLGVTYVEHRLPRITRAKAWFRVSQCYGHLDFIDKAQDALAKALESCEDDSLMAELSQHSLRLDTLERLARDQQKKKFAGFWDKLQDRGGYAEDGSRQDSKDAEKWDKLNYWERFKTVEEVEEVDTYVDPEVRRAEQEARQAEVNSRGHTAELLQHLPPGAKWESAVKGLTKTMYKNIDKSFEAYLERKNSGQEATAFDPLLEQQGNSPRIEVPPAPKDVVPPRPKRKDELPLSYSPRGGRPSARTRAARSPSPAVNSQEAFKQVYSMHAREEKAWQEKFSGAVVDSDEEQELQEARDRIAMQRWERLNKEKKAWLEALDDSD
eukprot:TRINITY_DN107014_c0_g1_i1.p1 TRINITY_DN107014_c0_g1~~TRINITY_DN107014_c0_g1_i1.p1  ORF type:complete len:481 (+),score=126.55 TRINITY_DN107014_c0_g1_i1:62-1444(+)